MARKRSDSDSSPSGGADRRSRVEHDGGVSAEGRGEPVAPWIREAEADLFYEHAPLGLGILDTELRYVRVNPVLAEINGVPVEDHIGRTGREVVPDLAEDVEARMRTVLETGVPMRGLEVRGETPSRPGVIRTWTASWVPLHDAKGDIIALGAIVFETTEMRRIERQLRELTENLEREVADRTALTELRSQQLQALAVEVIEAGEIERSQIAELLHDELQQLLASVRLRLDATARDGGTRDTIAEADELLAEALEISARLSHHLSPALLHHVSSRAALEWLARDMADQFGLEVELTTDGMDDLAGTAPTTFLFRALEELLLNVATHSGARRARVRVTRNDDWLMLQVEDEGRGFDPEEVASSVTPAGFGLLKLRERATFIGGSLEMDSAPDRGTAITLTIPTRLAAEAADVAPFSAAATERAGGGDGSHPAAGNGCLRLLVADDHRVMRRGLVGMFDAQPDLEVVGEAADGREALELSRQLRPDVVIMDVSMPEMDGIESTRRIKAQLPRLRVVGLTMHDDDGIARSMREAGAEAFVSKAASPTELLRAIRGLHAAEDGDEPES